jgi:hypothetical protein
MQHREMIAQQDNIHGAVLFAYLRFLPLWLLPLFMRLDFFKM